MLQLRPNCECGDRDLPPASKLAVNPPSTTRVSRAGTCDEAAFAGWITGLVTGGVMRRSGVERSLVAAMEHWARSGGHSTIIVRSNVVRPEAHSFCERLGFERTKTPHACRKTLVTGQ